MYNQKSVLENETHRFLWDFQIQTDHLISTRRPDLVKVYYKKRTCRIVDLAVLADHRLKNQRKRKEFLDLARELKTMEDKSIGDTTCN